MKMKTWGLIGIVVALHCAVIGSVLFISGCGTTPKSEPLPETPIMPPPTPPSGEPAVKPAEKTTAAAPAPESKPVGGGEYVVQAGDSLAVIAKRCHVTQAELIEANKLTDPNKIKIGQKLILPATGHMPAAAPKTAAKAKAKPAPAKTVPVAEGAAVGNEYIVKSGDSLSKIAARHGVKTSALREANKLQSDNLKVGQKLAIPEAKKAVPTELAPPVVPAPPPAPPAPAAPAEAPAAIQAPAAAPATPMPEPAPAAKATMAADNATGTIGSGIVHTVQANEDLSSIAKLYTVTVDEIAELNQLPKNAVVQVGQRLKIP